MQISSSDNGGMSALSSKVDRGDVTLSSDWWLTKSLQALVCQETTKQRLHRGRRGCVAAFLGVDLKQVARVGERRRGQSEEDVPAAETPPQGQVTVPPRNSSQA
jgi:hypothetical protein